MPKNDKQKIFVSYSSSDEDVKDRLLAHLSVGPLKEAVELWHDQGGVHLLKLYSVSLRDNHE